MYRELLIFVRLLILLLLMISYKYVNCQIPTAPTPDPTDPTIETVPTAPTLMPTPPTIGSTTTTVIMTTSTTTIASLTCPPSGIHHFPVDNCQEFLLCVYGREHMGRCADGTLFDPPTSSCLNANNVDCENRYRP